MSLPEQSAALAPAALQQMGDRDLQRTLAAAVKVYAERQQEGNRFPPFGSDDEAVPVTGTDAVIAASAILEAASVEIFELGMWKAWGTI